MQKKTYEIMHKDKKTASIDETGHCTVYDEAFMPYSLYLEEAVAHPCEQYHQFLLLVCLPSTDTGQDICEGNLKQYWCTAGRDGQGPGKACTVLPLRVADRCFLGKDSRRGDWLSYSQSI